MISRAFAFALIYFIYSTYDFNTTIYAFSIVLNYMYMH